jgi:hypothetical protein
MKGLKINLTETGWFMVFNATFNMFQLYRLSETDSVNWWTNVNNHIQSFDSFYLEEYLYKQYIYTIIDLFCQNGFQNNLTSKAKPEMRWEVYFKQNISMIVCLSRIGQGDISDVNITSH